MRRAARPQAASGREPRAPVELAASSILRSRVREPPGRPSDDVSGLRRRGARARPVSDLLRAEVEAEPVSLLETAAALLASGWGALAPAAAADLDEVASWIADACDPDGAPVAEPSGRECVLLVTTIWALEGGGQFNAYPTGRWTGSGLGPLQLVPPRDCWRNTRLGRVCLPPHELLGGASAIRHGVEVLRWKAARARGDEALFRAWNGGGSPGYVGKAMRVLGRIRRAFAAGGEA